MLSNAQGFFGGDSDDPSAPLLKQSLKFIVTERGGVLVREEPSLAARRKSLALHHGEIFEVDDIVTLGDSVSDKTCLHWQHRPTDRCCFLRLKNGDGWVIDQNMVTLENMVEQLDPNMSGVERWQFNLRQFFQSKRYEWGITAIIVINALLIGLEIDHVGIMSYRYWLLLNTTFTLIYLTEMSCKLAVFKWVELFQCPWNVFDVAVTVVTTIGDAYMLYIFFATHGHGESLGYLALIPVLRLLRLLRVARLFQELRMLVNSFVNSIAALTWIAIFALLWFYICACVVTVFLGREDMLANSDVEDAAGYRKRFATIPRSMYTLFEVMTLEALTDVVSPLVQRRPYLFTFFLLFICVTAFFLLNLVTAVVVKRTMSAQNELKKANEHVEEDLREALLADMYAAFLRQNNENDLVTVQNFREMQEDEKVQCVLTELNWDSKFLNSLIVMVDHNKAQDEFSLKEMRELWVTYLQPLDTDTLLHSQMHIARRLDMQEKLCLKLLEDREQQTQLLNKLLDRLEGGGSSGSRK